PRWGLLLLPVLVLLAELVSQTTWFDRTIIGFLLAAIACVAVIVLIATAPVVAADLAVAGVVALGLYGVAAALVTRPPYTSFPWTRPVYGLLWVTDVPTRTL